MIRVIEPATQREWDAYYEIRWKTLREPWNQPRGTEKDDREESSIHLFALDENDNPLGVGRLQFNDQETAQIRFMGVLEEARGKGVGKKIIEQAEKIALDYGRKKIILQARDYAVPFYESCGYKITEKTFLLWNTIQHFLMEKNLE